MINEINTNNNLSVLKSILPGFIDTTYVVGTTAGTYYLARTNNDIYGNPLYKLEKVFGNIEKSKVAYRNYTSKGYYLLQTYNIVDSLERLFKDINSEVILVKESNLIG